MLNAKVGGKQFKVLFSDNSHLSGTVNGEEFDWDLATAGTNKFHLLYDNASFSIEVVKFNQKEKKMAVKVNDHIHQVNITDHHDILLKKLGMDITSTKNIKEIKAPMPGLVLDVMVLEGAEVKKGDPVLVLEAMKMENILKSPADGRVKSITVKKESIVEKNEILIKFE